MTILIKELKNIVYSVKYAVIITCVLILTVLSFVNSVAGFLELEESIIVGRRIARDNIVQMKEYDEIGKNGYRVYVKPDGLAIFDFGIFRSIGFDSLVQTRKLPRLSERSTEGIAGIRYYDSLDPMNIINNIISLFAILFSYNMISGERQAGMLRIIFANRVSRNHVLSAKIIGGLIPLWLLVVVPMSIGGIIVQVLTGSSFSFSQIIHLIGLILLSMIFAGVFFMIGLLISSLTKTPFSSFLFSLVIWVLLVMIIPRFAVDMAKLAEPMDTPDQVNNEILAFNQDLQRRMGRFMAEYFEENPTPLYQLPNKMPKLMNYARQRMTEESLAFEGKLQQRLRRQRNRFTSRATLFSMISPSSSFLSASQRLTRTHITLLSKIEDNLDEYRISLNEYLDGQITEETFSFENLNKRLGVNIGTDASGNIKATPIPDSEYEQLDLSDLPEYRGVTSQFAPDYGSLLLEVAILAVMFLVCLISAVLAFQRYDVR